MCRIIFSQIISNWTIFHCLDIEYDQTYIYLLELKFTVFYYCFLSTIPSTFMESIFSEKYEESTSFWPSWLLNEISDTQPPYHSSGDGIKLNVFHGPEETTQETFAQQFIFYDWKLQVPKSLHYQVEDSVINQLKGRGNKVISPTFNKGNLRVAKRRNKPFWLSPPHFHSNMISGKSSLAHGRINLYFENLFLSLLIKSNKKHPLIWNVGQRKSDLGKHLYPPVKNMVNGEHK